MFPAQPIVFSPTCGKDTKLAIKYRNKGNALYEQGKFFKALEFYNKSLMFSVPNSLELSFAYANRSAVYLEEKEFQLCLDNIQLAIDSGYPVEKMQTLKDREAKCKKMMESEVKSDDDDPWTFFKLSYPANEKIPFIAGCLEMREDEEFGRHIVTNRDLKPGDIIAIEEPFFHTLDKSEHLRCTNCLKSNKMNLIPSEILETVMFCSKNCVKEAEDLYLKAETPTLVKREYLQILPRSLAICGGSFKKLEQLMFDPELMNKTVFDFDLSDRDDPLFKYHQLLAFIGLQGSVDPEVASLIEGHPTFQLASSPREKQIAKKIMLRSMQIAMLNNFQLDWSKPKMSDNNKFLETENESMRIGEGVCIFGSLFSHSCLPNIERTVVDNKVVFSIRRTIAKGQQLFISYGCSIASYPYFLRQRILYQNFKFKCECEACEGNYPYLDDATEFAGVPLAHNLSIAEYKKNLKKHCTKLANNQRHPWDPEMSLLMDFNAVLKSAIAKNEPFIF